MPTLSPPQAAAEAFKRLKKAYPEAKVELGHANALELLVATILSAQCTDARVNQVTPALFKKYRTAKDYAKADPRVFEQEIRSTGFYKNKAKNIINACKLLVEKHGGQVPKTMTELVELPGVARKTANIVRGNAFGQPAIGVDTHVMRLSQRLGFTTHTDPDKIEADLTAVVLAKEQIHFCHLLQAHGRRVCVARKPRCPECTLNDLCPYPEKTNPLPRRAPRPAFGRQPGRM